MSVVPAVAAWSPAPVHFRGRGGWEGLGDLLGLPPTSAHSKAEAAALQEVQGKAAFLPRPLGPPLLPTFPYNTPWALGPSGEGWGWMVTSVKWAHSSSPGRVGMRTGRCSVWSPALQVTEKELSKERSHGSWRHPDACWPGGQESRRTWEREASWPGQGLHTFSRADSPGSLSHFHSHWVLWGPPSASSFKPVNLDCAILPASLAFAVPLSEECPPLLCPTGSCSVPPPAGSPPGFPHGPGLGEGALWLQAMGSYLFGAVCRGRGRGCGVTSWQGPQYALISHVTFGKVSKQGGN